MTETQEVKHYQMNGTYRIVFEQAASTKGVIGFKVEVNSDDFFDVRKRAEELLRWAQEKAPAKGEELK